MKNVRPFFIGLFLSAATSAIAGTATFEAQPAPTPEEENSRDLFSYETTYTFESDFKESKLGHGDSLYDDFSYDHRFLVTGKWYLRLGAEYERYDFNGTDNGLPDHLQAAYAHIAYEYVVKDFPGVGIELDPGFYFQDHINGDRFDIPIKAFVSFPLKKDKIFAVVGLGWSLFQDPPVAPGGGIIWVFSDKLRLQAVFPKPALIYEPNDDWQFKRVPGRSADRIFRHQTPQIDRRCGLHARTRLRLLPRKSIQEGRSGAVCQDCGRGEILRENLAELSRQSLIATNFQPAGHIRPRAAKFSV